MGCTNSRALSVSQIDAQQRARINAILDFWYGAGVERNLLNPAWIKKWFGFSEELDKEVKDNFMGDYENFVNG